MAKKTETSWLYILGSFVLVIILIALVSYALHKSSTKESFVSADGTLINGDGSMITPSSGDVGDNEEHAKVSSDCPLNSSDASVVTQKTSTNNPTDCYPKDQLTAEDLLPADTNSIWAQVNPMGKGDLKDKNFLEAGHHIGINTVGQTLRNANYQLRSEPPNPQVKVSPWMQTTIEPDSNRRPLEIGA